MYISDLYLRNVKGAFFGGFVSSQTGDGIGAALIWTGHIVLFPITLTFGAGIKTLFDFFTRKYVPASAVAAKIEDIKSIDGVQMDYCLKQLKYEAKSNSSIMLLSNINSLNHNEKKLAKESYYVKMGQLMKEQVTEFKKAHTPYAIDPEVIKQIKLDEGRLVQLAQYSTANTNHLSKNKLAMQKRLIQNYLGDEKNNGKRLFQNILGLFAINENVKNKRQFDNDVADDNNVETTLTSLPI